MNDAAQTALENIAAELGEQSISINDLHDALEAARAEDPEVTRREVLNELEFFALTRPHVNDRRAFLA